MKHINYIAGILMLALADSSQAISFHDYYHGNAELGIPPHEKEVNAAVATGHLRLNDKGLTDLIGFDEVPGLNTLRIVDFSYNRLTELPNNIFHGLTALERLYLNANRFSSLPQDIFHGLIALQELFLSNNRFAALSENIFHGLTALQDLYLNDNQLATFPVNIFHGLTALRLLYLSSNRIDALPENIFHGLTALTSIYLSFNQLIVLPENIFHGLAALQDLHLGDNLLSTLPANIFNGADALILIYLENNPIPFTEAQLRKKLHYAGMLHFKTPEQKQAEKKLFTAIRNADASVARKQLDNIETGKVRTELDEQIVVSKILDANGDNLLHAAIRDAAERIKVIDGMSVGLPEDEKKVVKQLQTEQKKEINDRYMKIVSAILSCGDECVQNMLFTRNAQGQMVVDAMVAKLGFGSPITQAILSVLTPEESAVDHPELGESREKKIRMEETEEMTPVRPKRTLEQVAPEEKPAEAMADVEAIEKEQEEETEGRKRQKPNQSEEQ